MINVIADRYAQALFEVGEETQTTSELYQELSELVDIFNENKDLYNFLKSPLIGREDKKNVMQNIFKNQLSNSMNNFLKLVIDKDRNITICFKYDIVQEVTFKYENRNLARNPYGRKGKC